MSDDRATSDRGTQTILGALVAWNLFDIVVHIAVDEVEILRVSANLVLIAVAVAVLLGQAGRHPAHPLVLSLIVFVPLNLLVMVDKGPAAPMITFIVVSIGLTAAATQRMRPPVGERRITLRRP